MQNHHTQLLGGLVPKSKLLPDEWAALVEHIKHWAYNAARSDLKVDHPLGVRVLDAPFNQLCHHVEPKNEEPSLANQEAIRERIRNLKERETTKDHLTNVIKVNFEGLDKPLTLKIKPDGEIHFTSLPAPATIYHIQKHEDEREENEAR